MIKYEDLLSIDKIKNVYENIRMNTCHKEKLVRFELAFTSNIVYILDILRRREYNHHHYNVFLIKEPKYRIIMSETLGDKIVNHLISHYALLPSLEKKFINTNVATRKGMGTKKGIEYLKKFINREKENFDKVYVLKCDISKYFYNIDHEILLNKLRKDITDPDIYNVVKNIIESTEKVEVNKFIDSAVKREIARITQMGLTDLDKKKKELGYLPRYKNGKGLPIGNETSQILAIYYLSDFDHFIKEKLRIKNYVRYMDDFLIVHHDKAYLKEVLKIIGDEVHKLKLELNIKTQIYDLNKGFDFLGYKFVLKEKRLIVLLRNQNKKRIKRKLRRLKKKGGKKYELVKASYKGYFMRANAREFLYRLKL